MCALTVFIISSYSKNTRVSIAAHGPFITFIVPFIIKCMSVLSVQEEPCQYKTRTINRPASTRPGRRKHLANRIQWTARHKADL